MPVWDGFLFGMVLQLSVGPVCLTVLQRSMTQGFREAWRMIWGVALVDALYMGAAIGGLSLLLQIPLVKNVVMIGGACALIWFGVGSMRSRGEGSAAPGIQNESGSFRQGVFITMTNPLTVVFWSGVFGSLLATETIQSHAAVVSFAAGCVLSTLLFLSAVAVLGTYAAKMMQPVWIKRLNFVVGLFLIGFALALLRNGWKV